VNAANPSATNLHLQEADTIAKDNGIMISGFSEDYDGNTRPQGSAWDIGADEIAVEPLNYPSPPTNLRVVGY
jgi:hypothetical protein